MVVNLFFDFTAEQLFNKDKNADLR